jgi:hypothetical protein
MHRCSEEGRKQEKRVPGRAAKNFLSNCDIFFKKLASISEKSHTFGAEICPLSEQ